MHKCTISEAQVHPQHKQINLNNILKSIKINIKPNYSGVTKSNPWSSLICESCTSYNISSDMIISTRWNAIRSPIWEIHENVSLGSHSYFYDNFYFFYQTIQTMRTKRILMWDIIQDLMLDLNFVTQLLCSSLHIRPSFLMISYSLKLFSRFLLYSVWFLFLYFQFISLTGISKPMFKGLDHN